MIKVTEDNTALRTELKEARDGQVTKLDTNQSDEQSETPKVSEEATLVTTTVAPTTSSNEEMELALEEANKVISTQENEI